MDSKQAFYNIVKDIYKTWLKGRDITDASRLNSYISDYETAEIKQECKIYKNVLRSINVFKELYGKHNDKVTQKLVYNSVIADGFSEQSATFVLSVCVSVLSGCDRIQTLQFLQNAQSPSFSAPMSLQPNQPQLIYDKQKFIIVNGVLEYYNGNEKDVIIPYGVVKIGAAFKGNDLETVIIPDSVVSIEDNAFRSCYSLKNLTIPNSVLKIGNDAFSGCSDIEEIDIPSSVTHIGSGAFCFTAIKYIVIPDSVKFIGTYAFIGIKKVILPSQFKNRSDLN